MQQYINPIYKWGNDRSSIFSR